ncbi:response regulator [Luteimonas sp. BDR2-5]|uniref:Hpt domain-containing protein n=1 Tax=Proluteimonas luteida TaxID=2878685 RepID=UPI001E2FC16C|nr:Hpt domain-containing protein [Luteimonas sp. BDR2-5]MCD9028884.1 response regulator [Luteimonas sp. BDR2-5]
MTALRDAIDHTMLGWIKPELDEVLRQARLELEAFVEDPSDSSRMRLCAGYLHQAQGTLRMVELSAPAMVVEEMEQLADALRDGRAADRDIASAALLRGMLLLPDYLERLQGGHRDIPIVLLPLLNELRAARGEPGLGESILFAPDLARAAPESLVPVAPVAVDASSAALRALHAALQAWPADAAIAPVDAGPLADALRTLAACEAPDAVRRMLWVATRVAEALADGAVDDGIALRQVFASVEREARQHLDPALSAPVSAESAQEPTRQLLYHVAHAQPGHPALDGLRETFDLQAELPSASEIDHARSSLSGRNRALLDTVSGAVKEDLLRVKDALDLHLRTHAVDAAALRPQIAVLAGVADTLGMLGLGAARSIVQQQRETMSAIVDGTRPANEDTLLDVAGALLYVDASLDDQVSRLGPGSGGDASGAEDALAVEAQQTVAVVIREAVANFSDARQALVAFVETSWDHSELQEVPRLLHEVAGALKILEIPQAADYLTGVRLYTERELIARRRVPNGRQLDTFADALASLEYYLESLRGQRGDRGDILDIARASLEALGYWPLPAAGSGVPAVPETAPEPPASPFDIDLGQLARGTDPWVGSSASQPPAAAVQATAGDRSAAAPAPPAPPAVPGSPAVGTGTGIGTGIGGFEQTGDEIDDEIREVFLEEFAGEIENLDTLLPPWRAQPDNLELLRPIRRVFHTLKGSGRLVGARTLGEFSWAVESMLNRVLEGSRSASPAVVAMVDQAFYTLPQLQAVLRGDAVLTADLETMQASAARIAAGDDMLPVEPGARAPVVDVDVGDRDVTVPAPSDAGTAGPPPEAGDAAGEIATEAVETVPASVDALLLEILDTEVKGHLDTVEAWIASGGDAGVVDGERLLRALHTMHGAFAMAEVPVVGMLLAPAEEYARRLVAARTAPDPVVFGTLADIAAHVRDTLQQLHAPEPRVAVLPALEARIGAARDALPDVTTDRFAALFDTVDEDADEVAAAAEAERLETERVEAERVEAERLEAERAEAERLEAERLEAERVEAERLEAERAEAERLEAERLEAERVEAERLEAERMEAERLEAERLEAERVEAERLEAERVEAERLEAERLETERVEAERLEAERAEAERLEAERLEAERVEAERLEAERVEAERLEAERLEAERVEAERLEAERVEAERLEAERIAALRHQEHLDMLRFENERLEAERLKAAQEAENSVSQRPQAQDGTGQSDAADDAATVPATAVDADAVAQLEADLLTRERKAFEAHLRGLVEAGLAAAASAAEAAPEAEAETEAAGEAAFAADVVTDAAGEIDSVVEVEAEAEAEPAPEQAPAAEAAAGDASPVDVGIEAPPASDAPAAPPADTSAETAGEASPATEVVTDAAGETGSGSEAEAESASEQAPAAEVAAGDASSADIGFEALPASDIPAAPPADTSSAPAETDFEPGTQAAPMAPSAGEDPDAPLDMTGLDAELVDIFVEEGIDLLDHADGLLAQLRETADPHEPIVGLQRDLHTLKGGARMAGLMEIGELGHAMETLLESVAERRTDLRQRDIALLEQGFDRLHAMVTRAGAHLAIGPSQALVEAFSGTLQATAEASGGDAATSAGKPALAPLSEPLLPEATAQDDEEGALRGSQEQVRIRADLLDRLVTYAGEVAIYRARLEQQLGAFRGAMGEMAQTNTRLRDQLRRLDIETEAQIIARFQREGDTGDATFDPLELDRFSTLQQLSRALGESAADMTSLQQTLDDLTRQYETLLLQQSRVSSELQEGLMRTRMVPFDGLVPRLRRVVRQAAQETGKRVQLRLDGTQGELDRNVLERMVSPIEHMLRNAIAHGLETPAARREAGKPEEGTVHIAVRREGSEVVLEIGDNGAGLDRAAIRRRAEERGLVRADAVLGDGDLDALILEPGFSTATEVSRLAGRGVGMDVVASEVRQLGGSVDIRSRAGQGATFTLRLPQTLAVTQSAFVRIGDTSFAVPIASVRGVGRIARDAMGPDAVYRYGGEDYLLHDLGRLVGQAPARAENQLQMPLLLIRSGELRAAVAVDEIIGNREIVVKPVGPQVASIPGIFGATIMGDGRVVVILDVAPLVRRQLVLAAESAGAASAPESAPVEQRPVPLVMVVDDSVTMRKVTGRVLERQGFEVIAARDGVDALERMEERVPDLMLLDIEMPRMDGYELATRMKEDPRLREVTIMMITSRTGEKHRQRAFEIGVDRYLGKPYQENDLLRHVHELLKMDRDDE